MTNQQLTLDGTDGRPAGLPTGRAWDAMTTALNRARCRHVARPGVSRRLSTPGFDESHVGVSFITCAKCLPEQAAILDDFCGGHEDHDWPTPSPPPPEGWPPSAEQEKAWQAARAAVDVCGHHYTAATVRVSTPDVGFVHSGGSGWILACPRCVSDVEAAIDAVYGSHDTRDRPVQP
jgi:hypothetical protein